VSTQQGEQWKAEKVEDNTKDILMNLFSILRNLSHTKLIIMEGRGFA
jgi:hypothetical protein